MREHQKPAGYIDERREEARTYFEVDIAERLLGDLPGVSTEGGFRQTGTQRRRRDVVSHHNMLSYGRGVWKRDARFGAGLESSFSSFGETSLVVLTHRCQMGNGGEAAEGA